MAARARRRSSSPPPSRPRARRSRRRSETPREASTLRKVRRGPSAGIPRGAPIGKPRLAPSLVKSALQKCVRRGRVGGAHRTAALLLAEAPADALRRLLVIAVEDAAAHPDSPLVAWLMCADSKGFKLPRAVVDAVAGFAAELAACAIKDRADPPPKTPPEGRSPHDPSSGSAGGLAARNVHAQCAGLGARASAIVAALAIRARFGGMAGDVEMLRSFAATWRSRFSGEDGAGSADWWLARLDLAYAEARRKAREALGMEGVSSATGPGVVSRRDVPRRRWISTSRPSSRSSRGTSAWSRRQRRPRRGRGTSSGRGIRGRC